MNNRLLREQQKYYDYQMKIMKRTLRDTRKLNHDLKNKLSPIYKIAKANENEELLNFVSKLMNGYYPIKEYSKTGNTCIDSILNYKLSEAQKNNITISTEIIFPSKLKINTLDLAVILGNLIDNAMEGAQTVKKNNPWIDIKLKYTKGRLIININNSFDGFVYKQGDKIISRKDKSQNHGLGLDSVKDIIKKYNGIISTNYNQDTFKVKVLMYV
jgi:sensor histidine kinase regulating citrate/malate metabolism